MDWFTGAKELREHIKSGRVGQGEKFEVKEIADDNASSELKPEAEPKKPTAKKKGQSDG